MDNTQIMHSPLIEPCVFYKKSQNELKRCAIDAYSSSFFIQIHPSDPSIYIVYYKKLIKYQKYLSYNNKLKSKWSWYYLHCFYHSIP